MYGKTIEKVWETVFFFFVSCCFVCDPTIDGPCADGSRKTNGCLICSRWPMVVGFNGLILGDVRLTLVTTGELYYYHGIDSENGDS